MKFKTVRLSIANFVKCLKMFRHWPFVVVVGLGILITFTLYGSPFQKRPLGNYQSNGTYHIPELRFSSVFSDSLSIPNFVSEYVIHFDYFSDLNCFKPPNAASANLQIHIPSNSEFLPYAKKAFPVGSCFSDEYIKKFSVESHEKQRIGDNYFFCVPVNSAVAIKIPTRVKPEFDAGYLTSGSEAIGSKSCSDETGDLLAKELSFKDVNIYATPVALAWLLNLLAVTIVSLFVVDSVLGIFDRNNNRSY